MAEAPYRRLAAVLRARIADGTYPPGTPIPSYRRLADDEGVSQGAAYRAVELLRTEGLLSGGPRRRLTVAYPPGVRTLRDPDADWPHGRGDTISGTCRAGDDLAQRLQVAEGARLYWWRTELLDPDNRPAMLATTWRRWLRARAYERVECELRSHAMGREEAAALGLAVGTAALLIERTRHDADGRPVEAADLVLPADRWRLRL